MQEACAFLWHIAGQAAAANVCWAQEHCDGATWSHRDARCQFSRLNWSTAVQRQHICLLAHLLLVRWPLLLCSGAPECCHLPTHKCHISITCLTEHETPLCGVAESLSIMCQHAQGPGQTQRQAGHDSSAAQCSRGKVFQVEALQAGLRTHHRRTGCWGHRCYSRTR